MCIRCGWREEELQAAGEIQEPKKMIGLRLKNDTLRILHLSDIQEGIFGIKTDRPHQYQNLLADLQLQLEHINEKTPIDLIMISGDLTSKGGEKEFEFLSCDVKLILVFVSGLYAYISHHTN